MTTEIYTAGYNRMTPDQLLALAAKLNAYVVDIRFSAWGKPGWKGYELRNRHGGRYMHLKSLGNAAYKTGGMQIADYAAGRHALAALDRPAILLCACADPEGCHRTVVGHMLADDGFTVTEISLSPVAAKPQAIQLSLLG